MSYVICEQQRCRSACAYAQSDQCLCCSLLRQYNISEFYSRNFKTLASFCGCAGRFVSGLFGNPRRHILSCHGSIFFWPYALSLQCQVTELGFCFCTKVTGIKAMRGKIQQCRVTKQRFYQLSVPAVRDFKQRFAGKSQSSHYSLWVVAVVGALVTNDWCISFLLYNAIIFHKSAE